MDEENQIAGQPGDQGDDTESIDNLPFPDESDAIGPQTHIFQRAISMVMGIAGSTGNPILRRLTSDHITQMLNNQENANRRAHDSESSERRHATWVTIWFGTLGAGIMTGLTVFFGVREQYDIVAAIVTGVLGFAAGIAVGRQMRR